MIRADQIPDEVVETAARVYRTVPLYTTHDDAIRAAIAAAINAWPGGRVTMLFPPNEPHVVLPLPQKGGDA